MKKLGCSIFILSFFMASPVQADNTNLINAIAGKYGAKPKGYNGSLEITIINKDTGDVGVSAMYEAKTACGFSIDGAGKLEGNVLTLKSDDPEAKDCVAKIEFTQKGKNATLSETSDNLCGYLHGAGCGLYGEFTKKR